LRLTLFKAVGVAVASALYLALLQLMLSAARELGALWLPLTAFAIGYALADFFSGAVHWFCDTFCSETTPIIGRMLIFPFREHHLYPKRITECRFIEQDTGNFFVLIAPLAAMVAWSAYGNAVLPQLAIGSGLLGLTLGSFCTNLFHKWAHSAQPPAAVRWLQRGGLVLSPERHALHHLNHDRSYCVTSGWLNPVLDRLEFFPRLERMVRSWQK